MSDKKKISWISPEYYVDVDLPIISKLKEFFDIYWLVIEEKNSVFGNTQYIESIIPTSGNTVKIEYIKQKYRLKDFRNIFWYSKIITKAKNFKPDIYYISNYQMPYGILLYKLILPIDKVVVPCHNVSTPKGASTAGFTEKYTRWWISTFKNIQVFSKSQKIILETKATGKNVLFAYLALKDYGEPQKPCVKDRLDIVRFLNFGIIQRYKRADLLIEAGNLLFERGYHNFRIRIAGNCKDWSKDYAPLVRHHEVFEFDIRRIPNEEVANLFADSHYFVLPYQDIAQSGAITVAFRYNLPVIASDIPPFKEFVEDGVTGLTFKSENAKDLADRMQFLLDYHSDNYSSLQINQRFFVEREFSIDNIVSKYREYLMQI